MADERRALTRAEESLARILGDAVIEDVLSDVSDGPWVAVRCDTESVQKELANELRARGYEVILRSRTA